MNASNYASIQNAKYDEKNNLILYGESVYMQPYGVSDGTCNQITPYITKNKCGCGVAGGNPYKKSNLKINTVKPLKNFKTLEQFETVKKAVNITFMVNVILIILIIMLFKEIMN